MQQKNIAYYLKYRPQSLTELIGQESVKLTLLSSLKSNKLSHAYLFAGPRGTGKTSTARILAKMVNCLDKNPPCNKCDPCLSITDGSNMDLIEIDAASNRGIDDIRSLREKIKLAPTGSRKKVYIIDEVHMLTAEAFNGLLKTLEEPPSHALFILATTDVTKIPQTILSRTQRLDFKLATAGELMQVLEKITKKESIDIDKEALQMLARKAEGSFRDAVKLLDQISAMEGKITSQSLEENLKSGQFNTSLDLIKSFGNQSSKDALLTLSKQMEEGVDVKDLLLSLMDILRNLYFIKNGLGEQLVKSNLTEDSFGELAKMAENFTVVDLARILNILQEAYGKLKFASIPSLPLELAVVEICRESSPSVIARTPSLPSKIATVRHNVVPRNDNGDHSDSSDISKLKEKWTFVLETIRPYNFSLEALLRSTNISSCSDSEVIMEVPYSFHQRILEAPKNRDLLESIFSDVLGRQVKVATILGNRPSKIEDVANIEVAADDEIIRVAAEIFEGEPVN